MIERETIVAAARGWLGTPYHHQASRKSVGCDCLGLIRGLWRELCGPEPEAMPPYTRDWGSATGSETLIEAACRHLERLADVGMAAPGDVLVFRMRDRGVAKHAGVLVSGLSYRRRPVSGDQRAVRAALDSGLRRNDEEGPRMIHAQEGLGVVEIPLGRWWWRRIVAAFRFPGVTSADLASPRGGEVGTRRVPGEGGFRPMFPLTPTLSPAGRGGSVPGVDS